MDLQTSLTGFAAANLAALNIKIIWDWLKRRNGTPALKSFSCSDCPAHNGHSKGIEDLRKCVNLQKQDITRHEVIITERTHEIFKKLEEGNKEFKNIAKQVGSIRESIAAIEQTLKNRG